jgi:hypothetical protein
MNISRWMHAAAFVAALAPGTARAQKDSMPGMPGMPGMEDRMAGVLGIPHTRLGSGISYAAAGRS